MGPFSPNTEGLKLICTEYGCVFACAVRYFLVTHSVFIHLNQKTLGI